MDDRGIKRYEMFNRVVVFGVTNAADFPKGSKAAVAFGDLDAAIKAIDAARALQQGGRATAREVRLDALRIDMKNIARTAREINETMPGFADRFRMPASSSQAALLTAGRQMLVELETEETVKEFVAYELPATFAADLAADLKKIDDAKGTQDTFDNEGVKNTAALGKAIDEGFRVVAKLNAIMHNKYTRDPVKLVAWKSASHTERIGRREKPDTPPAPPTTTT